MSWDLRVPSGCACFPPVVRVNPDDVATFSPTFGHFLIEFLGEKVLACFMVAICVVAVVLVVGILWKGEPSS
jgi:hypothetical protein